MGINNNPANSGQIVDDYINTAYDTVKVVADNIAALVKLAGLTGSHQASDTEPTTRPDGSDLESGDTYFNTATNVTYTWNDTSDSWVAMTDTAVVSEVVTVDATMASTGTITLTNSYAVGDTGINVFLQGVFQTSGVDYTETDSHTLDFGSGILLEGDLISVVIGTVLTVSSLGALTHETLFTTTASQAAGSVGYTVPESIKPSKKSDLNVYVQGAKQASTAYAYDSVTGIITFSGEYPGEGDEVQIINGTLINSIDIATADDVEYTPAGGMATTIAAKLNSLHYATLAAVIADVSNLQSGYVLDLAERVAGSGGGLTGDVIADAGNALAIASNQTNIVTLTTDLSLQVRLSSIPYAVATLFIEQWGADRSFTTDSTDSIQAAIDYAEANDIRAIAAGDGHFKFTTLNITDSLDTGRAKRGKITVRGAGRFGVSEAYGSVSEEYGTLFESTETTNNPIVVSNNNSAARQVILKDFTLITSSTGYGVQAEYCPEFEMNNVAIRCKTASAKALLVADCWLGKITNCVFIADIGVTSTVAGVELRSTLFAGSLKFENTLINHFNDSVWFNSGANFTTVIFDNCQIQKYHRYGMFVESPVWNLVVRDLYTESGSATSAIKVNPGAGSVSNFSVDGMFILGGTDAASWYTGPILDFTSVDNYTINKVKYYQPWTTLLNINDNSIGTVNTVDIQHGTSGNLPTGPLYMFTGDNVHVSNYNQTATTKIEKFDKTSINCSQSDNLYITPNSLSFGKLQTATTSSNAYDWANSSPRTMSVIVTTGGAGSGALRLPRANTVKDTDVRLVINDPASTQSLLIRNGSLANNIHTLGIGEAAHCYADEVNDKWLILPAAGISYGT